ncbi:MULTISPECIES: EF-hand domain-containing protein [unclassified Nodularia (in: cyanobacteria)]|uniref:EF-hand domain-containing protein n=1 Tax=unclassified Nodularia (in: cyanobacteria) TaxID=2656917 RepID=UPI0018814D2D|nr:MULTISPECIES: EF-hand domain-containing protein [unclassified Nodularia (in: cyanobacteria)]MBE9200763.1 ferric reductase-like transmembrane domain-containing protein [Nodularia sp. LEGE 06071]MCC2692082.1 ferric reductase-like transmembrane domain-containing protein [Nodularia sp. LEGE 04288]
METPKIILEELRQVFTKIAGEDQKIDQTEFKKALGLKDEYFANRLFSIFDTDSSGTIQIEEFLISVENLVFASTEEKLKFAYQLHDINGDDCIEKAEIADLIAASLNENNLSFKPEQINDLVDILFLEADKDKSGEISFAEFKALIGKFPDLISAMTVSPVSWLRPDKQNSQAVSTPEKKRSKKAYIKHYIQNNWVKIAFLTLYVAVNLFLFFGAVERYADLGKNVYVQIARGCGATLNFNGALILIPMMRHFMTRLRKSSFNDYLPIDESIEFHKLVGQVMFALAVVHTLAHFLNYSTLPTAFTESLFGTKAGLSGFLLLLVFTIMWVTAQAPIRQGGKFALFYIAHMGYGLWFILALIHGPVFWQWVLFPGLGFLIELFIRWRTTNDATFVVNASLLPSKVLGLEVQRPASFQYQPGDYLFIKCPSISKFEWHPFTISSAPETPDVLSLHIRAAGSWTGKLYQLFREQREEWIRSNNSQTEPGVPVYLDGPYGTPSTHIFESKYAVLIGAGIGVTPFASILKSILYRNQHHSSNINLEKVHFFWLNREQKAFEWFVQLLSQIEVEDTKNLFDINLYLTGAQQKSDMKSSTLFVAMDLMHSQTKVDLITGLKSQTKTGRPDWDNIFRDLAKQHAPHQVDVFFCGPPGLSTQLKSLCSKYGFGYRKENF